MKHPCPGRKHVPALPALHCHGCLWRSLCLPAGLEGAALDGFETMVVRRQAVARNTHLYQAGAPGGDLAAVLSGAFKMQCPWPSGGSQVIGLAMQGDLLGLDAMAGGCHQSDAVALTDSVVCRIPIDALEGAMAHQPALARRFHAVFAGELVRRQRHALWLGSARAAQRLAVLLLDLAERQKERGGSATAFHLNLSREDIASYTGLTVESISRLLASFRRTGLLSVSNREVALLDMAGLRAAAGAGAAGTQIMPCSSA